MSGYNVGMKHAYGVKKSNMAHAYAKGTGGVSDYNSGMKQLMGLAVRTARNWTQRLRS